MRKFTTILAWLVTLVALRIITPLTTYLTTLADNALMSAMVGKTPSTTFPASGLYLGWFTTNPAMPAGTGGVEVTTGQVTNYARLNVPATAFATPAAGVEATNTAETFPASTGGTGATVVGAGWFDALTGGNLWACVPVTSFSWATGVAPSVASAAASFTEA